jgi:hypothetical protein
MRLAVLILVASGSAAALAGCVARDDYPSLAPRAIEGVSLAEPAARAVPAATSPDRADDRFAAVVARARSGDAEFRRLIAEAGASLRGGRDAAVGSDAWGEAQQQLSRLQTARDPVVSALAELQTASEAPEAQADRGLADAAQRALETVRAIDASEAQALERVAPVQS